MTAAQKSLIVVKIRHKTGDLVDYPALCQSFLDNATDREYVGITLAGDLDDAKCILVEVDKRVRMVMPGWDDALRAMLKKTQTVTTSPASVFAARRPTDPAQNCPRCGTADAPSATVLRFEGDTVCLSRHVPDANGTFFLQSVPYLKIVEAD